MKTKIKKQYLESKTFFIQYKTNSQDIDCLLVKQVHYFNSNKKYKYEYQILEETYPNNNTVITLFKKLNKKKTKWVTANFNGIIKLINSTKYEKTEILNIDSLDFKDITEKYPELFI